MIGSPSPAASAPSDENPSASLPKPSKPAPLEERLKAASEVKVQTDILGLELGLFLGEARSKLDPLGNPEKPALEEGDKPDEGDEQHRVLWELTKTDFKNVYVKTNDEERIVYISGFIRAGKEIPFETIGEVEKAPILNETTVAWDVVRPNKPLFRVVARGEKKKASSITIFYVHEGGE